MSLEHGSRLPRVRVEKTNRAAVGSDCHERRPRVEDRPGIERVQETLANLPGLFPPGNGAVPDGHAMMASDRDDSLSIAAVGHGGKDACRVPQNSRLAAGAHVPNAYGTVPRCGDDLFTVAAEGDIVDEAFVAAKDAIALQERYIPKAARFRRARPIRGASHPA